MSRVCLVIIYNHNYEKNISVLNRIYAGRFSAVYHVMPFYQGDDPNVIGVYENSYQFSGYIAQAASRFVGAEYTHYVFVADDMVLNPVLNEDNIVSSLKLGTDDAFISSFKIVSDRDFVRWPFSTPSVLNLLMQDRACEWRRFMPSIDDAREAFSSHGLDWHMGLSDRLYRILRSGFRVMRTTPFRLAYLPPFNMIAKYWKWLGSSEKTYPLAWGYSDFLVIPQSGFKKFTLYAGVLAACRVFVEVAIPTAVVLSCKKAVTLAESKWSAENGVEDCRIRPKIEADSNLDYSKLVAAFPRDYLYIHPVKLSKWRNLP